MKNSSYFLKHILSITATVALTCFVFQSQAAPSCHGLLLPTLSKNQIAAAINEMATLRLDLDLTQVQGTDSSVSKSFEPLFETKLEELYERLQGQKSRVEIHEMKEFVGSL